MHTNKNKFLQEQSEGTEESPFSLRSPVQFHRQDRIAMLVFGNVAFDGSTCVATLTKENFSQERMRQIENEGRIPQHHFESHIDVVSRLVHSFVAEKMLHERAVPCCFLSPPLCASTVPRLSAVLCIFAPLRRYLTLTKCVALRLPSNEIDWTRPCPMSIFLHNVHVQWVVANLQFACGRLVIERHRAAAACRWQPIRSNLFADAAEIERNSANAKFGNRRLKPRLPRFDDEASPLRMVEFENNSRQTTRR